MITGDVKQKIDRVWDAFWSGGNNPLEVIEQITYLLFIVALTICRPAPSARRATRAS